MVLGIPAYTVLRVFAREFFHGFKAVQKITSSLDLVQKDKPPRGINIKESRTKNMQAGGGGAGGKSNPE